METIQTDSKELASKLVMKFADMFDKLRAMQGVTWKGVYKPGHWVIFVRHIGYRILSPEDVLTLGALREAATGCFDASEFIQGAHVMEYWAMEVRRLPRPSSSWLESAGGSSDA